MIGQWNVPLFFLSCILTLISIPFLLGFGARVIPGFSLLSKEDQKRYNKKLLCRLVGLMLLCLAGLLMLYFFLGEGFAVWFFILSCLVVACFAVPVIVAVTKKKKV